MELNVFLDRISEPARRAIEQLRCTKLEDLLSYSDKELLALHGLGPKTIRILYDFLEENKLDRNPKRSALLILLSASGCLAIASTALDVAIPIPIPAPIPVKTAIPAPIATNITFSSCCLTEIN